MVQARVFAGSLRILCGAFSGFRATRKPDQKQQISGSYKIASHEVPEALQGSRAEWF